MAKVIVMREGVSLNTENQDLLEILERDWCYTEGYSKDVTIMEPTQALVVVEHKGIQRLCPVYPNTYCSLNDLFYANGRVYLNRWSVGGLLDARNRDIEDVLKQMVASGEAVGYVYLKM